MSALPSLLLLGQEQAHRAAQEATDVIEMFGATFRETSWSDWMFLLVCIFIAAVVGKLVHVALRGMAQRLENRQAQRRALLLRDMAGPANLALITMGLAVGLLRIQMTVPVRDISRRSVYFLIVVTVGWFFFNLVDLIDLALRQVTSKTATKLDDQLVPLIRKTLRVFLVAVLVLFTAESVFGLDVTAWIAGLGIAGLAVSLAAQDSVKNLFGSITIFMDKPFQVGDRIRFDGFDGPVEEIGFRSTKMRTLEGHLATIPNMRFIDNSVENVGARRTIRRLLNVTVTYDTTPAKLEEAVAILRQLLASTEIAAELAADNEPLVSFNDFNADSLNIVVIYWYSLAEGREYEHYLAHCQKFNLALFKSYGEAGIEFAFPTQTLFLADDPARKLRVEVARAARPDRA